MLRTVHEGKGPQASVADFKCKKCTSDVMEMTARPGEKRRALFQGALRRLPTPGLTRGQCYCSPNVAGSFGADQG
ncbi:unnamed protein product [Arctogadus glacialis]